MGEVLRKPNNTKYYRILDGQIVRDANENDLNAVEKIVKNPKTGIETKKSVVPVFALEGIIDSVQLVEESWDNKPFLKIKLQIKDGSELLQIETKFKTEHGISLINRLASYVKQDLKKVPIVIGSYKMKDVNSTSDRYNQGFYIHYLDIRIPNLYAKENMPPETKWKETVINNEKVWDKTNYLKFFKGVIQNDIIPYFENLKKLEIVVSENINFNINEIDYSEEVF